MSRLVRFTWDPHDGLDSEGNAVVVDRYRVYLDGGVDHVLQTPSLVGSATVEPGNHIVEVAAHGPAGYGERSDPTPFSVPVDGGGSIPGIPSKMGGVTVEVSDENGDFPE